MNELLQDRMPGAFIGEPGQDAIGFVEKDVTHFGIIIARINERSRQWQGKTR
jgi:hypothetical protein